MGGIPIFGSNPEHAMPFAALTLQPDELAMLQRVYKTVLREEWFDRTDENERMFARSIVGFFQNGHADEERLFVESLALARMRFCKDRPTVGA